MSIVNKSEISMELLLEGIKSAIKELYANDGYLICNKHSYSDGSDGRVHERSIVFKFGTYLEKYLMGEALLSDYSLDVEYNRNKKTQKILDGSPVIPDVIIHKRGDNDYNLIVIEVKPWWSPIEKHKEDIDKLTKFTDTRGTYKYSFGLFLILRKSEAEYKLYVNKKEVDHQTIRIINA